MERRRGAAHAQSPDARCGHPDLRSLDAGCASRAPIRPRRIGRCLRWPARPARRHGPPLADAG